MDIMHKPLHEQREKLNIPPMALRRHVEATAYLERALHSGVRGESSSSIIIVGDTGAGKTTTLEAFVAKHQPYDLEDRTVHPVVSAEVPSTHSTAAVARALLEKMHAPIAGNSAEALTRQLKRLIRECGVQLIILDEVQHLIERGQIATVKRIADWLKSLINETGVTLVLLGMPSTLRLLRYNAQLRRRFSASWAFPQWSSNCQEDVEEFCGFLSGAQRAVGATFEVDLIDADLAQRMFLASNGGPGYVEKILVKARAAAFDRGGEVITIQDLHTGFTEGVARDLAPNRQPFLPTFDFRPLTNPGEPFGPDEA